MSKNSTALMWVTVALMAAVYVFPLWTIDLRAPQYPDGLGLHIWIGGITGRQPHDLQNINGLNHYIGMRVIEPDDIPELEYMKYIAAALIALAAAVALTRRRWLLGVFVAVAVVLSAVGMYDFWQWEYAYGHELDPSAAIKVPGMSYQPPMFGTKQLLNFRTTAWPGVGGWGAMAAVGLSALILVLELRSRTGRGRRQSSRRAAVAVLALVAAVPGCSNGPHPIEYGADACESCRMTIADQRYGAEAVTRKGRAYKFDSVECLAGWLRARGAPETDVSGLYVTDFLHPGILIDATKAVYLRSDRLPSPMGQNVTAFATPAGAGSVRAERGGDIMDWTAARDFATGGDQEVRRR